MVPFCFGGHRHDHRVRSYCARLITLTPHEWNDRISQCEYGKAPTRQSHRNAHCCLLTGHARKQSKNSLALPSISKKVGTRCRSPSYKRFVEGWMQFTLHATRRTPYGASRLVQAMSAWLVITRRAPSRHSRDARIYGHTTTAMHKLSTRPPPPPLLADILYRLGWRRLATAL